MKGFSSIELLMTIGIAGIITLLAIPSSQFSRRSLYYSEIVQLTEPFELAVMACAHTQKSLAGCNAGSNGIPSALKIADGALAKLNVVSGVIIATPVPSHGILSTDTFILTPVVNPANGRVLWSASGGGVDHGYAQ